MDKILFGDNQFFTINHLSEARSRQQAIQFKDNDAIIRVIDIAIDAGINTFMCTTHARIAQICDHIRSNPERYKSFKIFPCMPYAHKYANAVTELGILGAIKQYVPGNIFSSFAKGGIAFLKKDLSKLMELLVDSEMKMFMGLDTPVIFLQNVLVDMLLGLGMVDLLVEYGRYIRTKYEAEPGYITMNMPMLLDVLESHGVINPIICTSINKIGFRMSGGIELYETYLRERSFRPVAMQVLAAGALRPKEAAEYLSRFPRIESILFGASSKAHIEETKKIMEAALMVGTVER